MAHNFAPNLRRHGAPAGVFAVLGLALLGGGCDSRDGSPGRDAVAAADLTPGDGPRADGNPGDGQRPDGHLGDGAPADRSVQDAPIHDGALPDVRASDGGPRDALGRDAVPTDAPPRDLASPDASLPLDAAAPLDASARDAAPREAGVSPDGSPPPTQPELCTSNGWCWMHPTPPVASEEIIAGLSASDVYVGTRAQGGPTENTWLLKYDGVWKLLQRAATYELTDVWAGSGKLFFTDRQGRVLTYDGSSLSTSSVGSGLVQIFGFSNNDVFVRGDSRRCDYPTNPSQCWEAIPALHRYDGTTWAGVPGNLGKTLKEVWGSSGTDLWAGGLSNGELERFDGTAWSTVKVSTSDGFGSLWGKSANDIYAVGHRGPPTPTRLWHYNGVTWMPTTVEGVTRFLGSLTATEALVLGGGIFNGSSVKWLPSPTAETYFVHAWGTGPQNLYALSTSGGFYSGVYRYDGSKWTHLRRGITAQDLQVIRASSRSSIFAVSAQGTVVRYDGTRWTAMSSGYVAPVGQTVDLRMNDAGAGATLFWPYHEYRSTDDIYIADSSSVRRLPLVNKTVLAVWGSSPTDIYAAGSGGLITHYDGKAWTQLTPNYNDTFVGITGFGPKEVYFLSYNRIVRFDGQTWSTLQPPRGQSNLTAICSSGTNNLVVVGDNGTMLVFDGTSWSSRTFASPPSGTGPSFCITQGPNDIWWGGRHYPNDIPTWPSWRPETAFYPVGNEIFAVGRAGTIVHRKLP